MGIIGKHVATTVGTSANDKKAAKARKLFDELMERLGNVVDAIGGDNGFKTLAVVEQLETFVDALETQGMPDNSTNTVVPTGGANGALPAASSDAAALGTDLLRVFGGDSNRAGLGIKFVGNVLASGEDTLDYFQSVLFALNRDTNPDEIIVEGGRYMLRSQQILRDRKNELESALYDLIRTVYGSRPFPATLPPADLVEDAKKLLARRAVVPTPAPAPTPAPTPAAVNSDDHYIHLLNNASGISAGSITDFRQYAQHVIDEMRKSANAALDAIGNKLSTRRTGANNDNDAYGTHLVKIIETRLGDLAKAENDLKAKDTELNKKIGEFNDLKKKNDATRRRIVEIADGNGITYNHTASTERIVEDMIDQKGDRFNKLSL